jgi:hypothetical protein
MLVIEVLVSDVDSIYERVLIILVLVSGVDSIHEHVLIIRFRSQRTFPLVGRPTRGLEVVASFVV